MTTSKIGTGNAKIRDFVPFIALFGKAATALTR